MVGHTVKSGYKLLCEDARSDADTVSNSEALHSFWKGIWKMHVPGKIKHFEWRSACSNALPTKMNLVKRKILDDDICQLCQKTESTPHALWEGETIQSLWNKNFSWVDRSQSARASFGDLVTLIRVRPHLFDIFATIAWSLRCRRNKVHLNEAAQPLERIAEEACQYLKTYRNAHWRPPKGPRRAKIKWHPLQNQL